jgi:hypothetical protein
MDAILFVMIILIVITTISKQIRQKSYKFDTQTYSWV